VDDRDKRLLNTIQADFPLVSRPFHALGGQLDLAEGEVIDRVAALKQRRIIRQISAIFDTRSLGYKSSLVAMRVQPEKLDGAAAIVNGHPGVSHCYLRPTYPDWPFSIFTMMHGQEAKDCQEIIDAISQATGITEYALLYSTNEYKKIRLKYFTPDLDEWEARARHPLEGAPSDRPVPVGERA